MLFDLQQNGLFAKIRNQQKWFFFAFLCLILVAHIAAIASESLSETFTAHEATIAFRSSAKYIVSPYQCLTLSWDVSNIKEIYINGAGKAGQDQMTECDAFAQTPTMLIRFLDGSEKTYSLGIELIYVQPSVLILLAALCAVLIFSFLWGTPLRPHIDFVYLSIIISISLVLCIGLRFFPWNTTGLTLVSLIALWLVVAALWVAHAGRFRIARGFAASNEVTPQDSRFIWLGVMLFLLLCTLLGFYLPMRHQFWLGGDEPTVLKDGWEGWSAIVRYDMTVARPLTPLLSILAKQWIADGVAGFLGLVSALRFLSSLLVYGILRTLLPKLRVMALVSAVLFIMNPSEPTRFAVVHMQGYHATLFFLLLSLFLFLYSALHERRSLLLLSCISLGISLLIVEVGFTVALLWPVILWLVMGHKRPFFIWVYAWFATLSLFGLRLLVFVLQTRDSYQAEVTFGGNALDSNLLVANFFSQLTATFRYFQVFSASIPIWLLGLAFALGVMAAVYKFTRDDKSTPRLTHKQFATLCVVGWAGIIFAILPFLNLTGSVALMRTQFIPSPFQAILFAGLIVYLAQYLPKQLARVWPMATIGILVLLTTVNAFQWLENRPFNNNVTYSKTVYMVNQLKQFIPALKPNTALVMVVDEGTKSPLGWQYYGDFLGQYLYNSIIYQVGYRDSFGTIYTFNQAGLSTVTDTTLADYSQLVVVHAQADGTLTLLEEIPSALLPDDANAALYRPHERIISTETKTLGNDWLE